MCLQGRVPDAQHMNVGSGTQLRQLLYAGVANSKSKQPASKATAKGEAAAADDCLEFERVFKVSCTAVVWQATCPSVVKATSHNLKVFDPLCQDSCMPGAVSYSLPWLSCS